MVQHNGIGSKIAKDGGKEHAPRSLIKTSQSDRPLAGKAALRVVCLYCIYTKESEERVCSTFFLLSSPAILCRPLPSSIFHARA